MTDLREDIILGVASLLGAEWDIDFSKPQELTWLCEALTKYGQEGWRYHASKSGSNHYRFKLWLLHIEAEVRIKWMEFRETETYQINDEKQWYHKKIMQLLETIKGYDKNN